MHIIDDTTDVTRYVHPGPPGLLPRDYDRIPLGAMPYTKPFAAMPTIPESEWPARIAAMEGRWLRNIYTDKVPDTSQGNLPYCWAWSLTQCVEAQRAVDGQPYVKLAPVSLGGSVNFHNEGNYCGEALAYCVANGICDSTYPDSEWSRTPSKWKTGWQEEAKNHRIREFWEIGSWAETVTALLLGMGVYVGLNWWSHAVLYDSLVMSGSEICVSGPNSWGPGERFVLKGTRKVPSEAYAVRTSVWSPK